MLTGKLSRLVIVHVMTQPYPLNNITVHVIVINVIIYWYSSLHRHITGDRPRNKGVKTFCWLLISTQKLMVPCRHKSSF